ncbi:MAG: hypothetical protein ACKVTZ_03100 [Bacteroidia bacterium]
MLKHHSFFFLLLVMGLCACDPVKIDATGMMTAELNAVSWSSSHLEQVSFNPTTGKLSLKGIGNGQKIHLYAEGFVNEGSETTFAFSQAQMMPIVYCPTFDSVGNPLPNSCGWEHGFSLEKQSIKWLIQSNCEKEVAHFTWEMTKDGQTATKTEKVNAAGNSQTPKDYWFSDTDEPSIGSYFLRTKQTLTSGAFAVSSWSNVIRNAVFINEQGKAHYCAGSIKLTEHDTKNKIISGTFSLNTTDVNGNAIQITNGKFQEVAY